MVRLKPGLDVRVGFSANNFNSNMVRLKLVDSKREERTTKGFQFQHGAIKA